MKLTDLTPKQKRIAIAEACGWKQMPEPGAGPYGEYIERCWISPTGEQNVRGIYLPNYPADLNAMHEAEIAAIYSSGLGMVYIQKLIQLANDYYEINGARMQRWSASATAAQRADAFLLATGRATV